MVVAIRPGRGLMGCLPGRALGRGRAHAGWRFGGPRSKTPGFRDSLLDGPAYGKAHTTTTALPALAPRGRHRTEMNPP